MAEMVRQKWEVYGMWRVLTVHPLGYLARLVEILFQLDILSRECPRGGTSEVRTSSISAVSSSIEGRDEQAANGNSH